MLLCLPQCACDDLLKGKDKQGSKKKRRRRRTLRLSDARRAKSLYLVKYTGFPAYLTKYTVFPEYMKHEGMQEILHSSTHLGFQSGSHKGSAEPTRRLKMKTSTKFVKSSQNNTIKREKRYIVEIQTKVSSSD
ncbi:hypothetical protein KUF71_023170 [Frankliniella fusca]|uniref:Uncharacterized protein n=1 Tax=Frankliniella fusca TaxID=407009 RepID=A0AAE1LBP3_9NEOP|nr:hypothetical protein KUF71_023170 [Frankliniella fusca]